MHLFSGKCIRWRVELFLIRPAYYRVKHGQDLALIARTFGVTARVLAAANRLAAEPREGEVLFIPPSGNVYVVQGGESRALLCGSSERFREKNATSFLYPRQEVML